MSAENVEILVDGQNVMEPPSKKKKKHKGKKQTAKGNKEKV